MKALVVGLLELAVDVDVLYVQTGVMLEPFSQLPLAAQFELSVWVLLRGHVFHLHLLEQVLHSVC